MNFMGLIKRGDKIDKAFEELQADMADALDESLFVVEDAPVKENDSLVQEDIQSDEGDLLRDEDIAAELSLAPTRRSSHWKKRKAIRKKRRAIMRKRCGA